ncbi:hypothetical protein SUNI508_09389 [Seiridium unicorne]|uniref:Glycosyltransferase family 25 protein n=1 Tax=Seiridium unicorne TaxID=138068 RepID=A0ABR2UQH8_9PEZI
MGRLTSVNLAYIGIALILSLGALIYTHRQWQASADLARPLPSNSWAAAAERHKNSDVFNKTLGFEKVFAIGLPDRSDKRDALTLMSALTGFHISWIDGVNGSNIPDKALPIGWDRQTLRDSNLGSWRGHINTMQKIVQDRIGSALIIEDDMDWDANIQTQLYHFAAASKQLQVGWKQDEPATIGNSPYGQDWDMLWVGMCGSTLDEDLPEWLQIPPEQKDARKVIISDDPTVPSRNHIKGNMGFSWDVYPPQSRMVFIPGDNICSFAYALSYSGAQKALQYLGLEGQHKPFDNHLSDLCRLRANGMRCVSITPSLFVHHKPKGNTNGDSDINGPGKGTIREVGFTENILYSTRLNLRNLITGQQLEKQWTD